jgi:hypothetical protein
MISSSDARCRPTWADGQNHSQEKKKEVERIHCDGMALGPTHRGRSMDIRSMVACWDGQSESDALRISNR